MKIAIILSNTKISPLGFYNSQEIGVAKELLKRGINIDIFSFSGKENVGIQSKELLKEDNNVINFITYSGIALPGKQAFSKKLLHYFKLKGKAYDVFQLHDSIQLMTVLCAKVFKSQKIPCLLYQGMYRDFDALWKKCIQKIYDLLFMKTLFSSISIVIGKTNAAIECLRTNGLPNHLPLKAIPVGLETTVFKSDCN